MRDTPLISVKNLCKSYKVAQRGEGLAGAIGYLFSRKHRIVKAVSNVTFDIAPGEIVGYIGRNGAGKSTTIKMLTGILVPTSGEITVDGLVPYRKRSENGRKIGVVFGQRTQLRWDIPVVETFRLLREVYRVPDNTYTANLGLFKEILEMEDLLGTPVRKLSLGQRMKCDLAASLLHNPSIVYLDEPTIGLDIVVKEKVREFIKTINRERGTTVILTTHDLSDIEDLCRRAIVIDDGGVVYDGELSAITAGRGGSKILSFDVRDVSPVESRSISFRPGVEVVEHTTHRLKLRVDPGTASVADVTRHVMESFTVADISIEEPGIESVVRTLYQEGWRGPS